MDLWEYANKDCDPSPLSIYTYIYVYIYMYSIARVYMRRSLEHIEI